MTTVPRPGKWRKSSKSGEKNCVEVAEYGDGAAVRDTKNRSQGYFTATPTQWQAFLDAIKSDRFEA
ncbi:DUF397 domain-containing protein [Saccharopolyspora endophytica]|uniref:DUF397 domain-containing protein n=1 Tax=Saccharopolyspora endophytica TaxID=543886 RepID=A0ABS5DQJ6_9PSEU|nr:DUF397 domain-containing protein [Saccharopolyspora endophytica]MBQ0928574.1 DUF397 domain-containing protein [Saccharopolyspora endophytica]